MQTVRLYMVCIGSENKDLSQLLKMTTVVSGQPTK